MFGVILLPLFPLPFWELFPLLFLFPFELDEFDAAVKVPLKKSVAPFEISIRADNDVITPIVFSATSCAILIVPDSPIISEQGEPSNCEKTLLAQVSNVPFTKSCCVKLFTKP